MPKRTDIQSILIVGAGPIVIGQACEFDYSGSQACRALKAEGYRIVLVNSNPATIMTDPDLADATYVEPITPEVVAKIIEKERPDAILPTMGGQTALNTALSLRKMGVLDEFNCEMIGAKAEAIDKAEDRDLFRKAMTKIGLETPQAAFVNVATIKVEFAQERDDAIAKIHAEHDNDAAMRAALTQFEREWNAKASFRTEKLKLAAQGQALEAYEEIGLPAIIRPSFTLGGTGGGIAYSREELIEIVLTGVEASPTHEVLVEESVLGWKEYEMEVVRDTADNAIIICSIENIDPMGIHTGDSMTVAPALTLTDKEYQRMRTASIAVLREIGVETGGSNVQFAVDPASGRMVVIEMNPRVSRSSALASKATGFPIAKVAARLAVGYTLDEIQNEITGGATPASFEPSIDYVVTKVPRFTFEKFSGTEPLLSTSMKSVGEAMAIGRNFQESLQKALRSMETGLSGLDEIDIPGLGEGDDMVAIRAALVRPTPDRLRLVAEAYRRGADEAMIHDATRIDPWFLRQIQEIVETEQKIMRHGLPKNAEALTALKAMGFSDVRLAKLAGLLESAVRTKRRLLRVSPSFRRIDSCAAEFAAKTAYLYSSYGTQFDASLAEEAQVSDRKKVMILGGGPNRIGQGIEFDYCCVHAAYALAEVGYETIMINCNPETVSTDPETSDRLYFEPLTAEDVLEIVHREQESGTLHGVIVQYGGQTPLKLAEELTSEGVPILGTSAESLDRAEDRDLFKSLVEDLGLKQPRNGIARTANQAADIADQIGYPVVIRPSYVLGGRGMEIVYGRADLERYINTAVAVSGDSPVLIDHYLQGAIEVDVDCLADGEESVIAGIMEHIEEAGIHSGDSACSLPPVNLSDAMQQRLSEQTKALAKALDVRGLMNVQFAIKDDEIYLLEVNPRASRTVPFVAKVTGTPWAKLGARTMAGEKIADIYQGPRTIDYIAVKEAVFPFGRFPGVDVLLGPEMRSTGEVMGIDGGFAEAFAKSQLGAGQHLPTSGTVFVSIRDGDKGPKIIEAVKRISKLGFEILATGGTKALFDEAEIVCKRINKVLEGSPNIVDAIKNGEIAMVINTTEGAKSIADSRSMRQATVAYKVPYFTTLAAAHALSLAAESLAKKPIEVRALQDYLA